MSRSHRARRTSVRVARTLIVLGGAAIVLTIGLASAASGAADSPPAVPYQLPVQLPASLTSPPVDASAPYTPAVMSLISQLLPTSTPTLAQIQNAATLLHDGSNTTCNAVGPVGGPVGLDAVRQPDGDDALGRDGRRRHEHQGRERHRLDGRRDDLDRRHLERRAGDDRERSAPPARPAPAST